MKVTKCPQCGCNVGVSRQTYKGRCEQLISLDGNHYDEIINSNADVFQGAEFKVPKYIVCRDCGCTLGKYTDYFD